MHASAQTAFDWSDRTDFEAARRGRIARYPEPQITAADGKVVWQFRDEDALGVAPVPATVHPLLWRQQQLNAISGLFEIAEGIYQLRGFDLANMTVIEGRTGLIVVDPLTSVEVSRAALQLYFAHRPRRPVVAVIFTHSHMDHFGGVRGVVAPEDVASGKVAIIAPQGFLQEAISENVTAGNAMLRRTIYYSGVMLPQDPTGSVGAGLGPGVSNGSQSFIAPTEEIPGPTAERIIDGVKFVFTNANGTEAPAEFTFFLPETGVLNVAEVVVRTQHNVLTPRGAKARDAALWWRAIDDMIRRFGPDLKILIGQHHWPSWGKEDALDHLATQRDLYKAILDRSLNAANKGVTIDEIGDAVERPSALAGKWSAQDHYGTFGSGAKATYQFYLGWYDGNPAHLDELPRAESAARYVEYMGGAAAILAKARTDYDAGRYRWVAEILDRVIFADPANSEARALQARTLTQLGYQQVSATWRNVYLTAARELREGVVPIPAGARADDFLINMTPEMLLDYAGIALSPERAANADLRLDLHFTDLDRTYGVEVSGGLLRYTPGGSEAAGATTIALDRRAFDRLMTGRATLAELMDRDAVTLSGDPAPARELFTLFDRFTPSFDIVTP